MAVQKRRGSEATGGTSPVKPPERWSAGRKLEVVLRLLYGGDLGDVSREVQVPVSPFRPPTP